MKPQLTAPAGTYEKLVWAVKYGADAVYFGTQFGSLRAYAGNLTLDEAAEGLKFLHKQGKKGYVTLNIYPFSDEYDQLLEIAVQLSDAGADAFIVSDLGLIYELKKAGINTPIHISTQANTTSSQAVLAYHQLGASRVNLARELSYQQIEQICRDTAHTGIELEVFIHGAVCFSYSGRCAISDYLTGRKANRGECTHPCRWNYYLVEEQRPNEYLPVFEDERGQYLFNSKDLALFEFVEPLKKAGVTSFKIEGRMKSVHYIASVVSLYRQLIDGKKLSTEDCLKLLSRVKNRGYSTGFMKGSIEPDDYNYKDSQSDSGTIFVGDITDEKSEGSVCFVRNKIFEGEKLEVLTPTGEILEIQMPKPLKTVDGQQAEFINNPQKIILEQKLPPYSILRRVE
ncbi:MAG: U32 family peptidase [Sedimentisphaerales bacterium]|nr:U32 family peptidase [Sedimentisphaerales bacterium]